MRRRLSGRFLQALLVCCACLFAACAARPVLYPNARLQAAGRGEARQDVAECGRLADDYVSRGAGRAVEGAVEGGAVGAAAGAAGGAVLGHAGRGAAVGAAGGAAGGFVRGLFHSRQPKPAYKRFVDRCLQERGYEVVGWE